MFARLWSKKTLKFSRQVMITSLTAAFLFAVYFWKIGSVTVGYSLDEAATIAKSHSLHALFNYPINAPHNIFLWGLTKLNHLSPVYTRSVSAAFGLIFVFCFYKISKAWFGSFIAWMSTLIFATTPLVMLASRNATADIMYLAPLVPAALYFWLNKEKNQSKILYSLLFLVCALALYTPGFIWVLIVSVVLLRSNLAAIGKKHPKWLTGLNTLGFLIVLAPLILSIARNWRIAKPLLLVPSFAHPITLAKSIGWMSSGLVWHTANHSNLQIGRLGLLSITEFLIIVIGCYAFWTKARTKIYGLLLLILAGVIGAGLVGQYSLLLFSLISAGLIMAAGLRYLLIEWQSIFPINPLPRGLALVLVSLVVGMSVFYGVRFSLVAWPHSVAIKQTYVLK